MADGTTVSDDLDGIDLLSCDFTFRAPDNGGAYARYDALFAFVAEESGAAYLVYADAVPDERGEVGTYASQVLDLGQVERATAQVEAGCTPRKPPVLDLAAIEDEAVWDLVGRVLAAVEAEEED